ncbi:MAG: cupredoxin domain-containing protein [Terracidiphilus sp.]
MRSRQHLLSLLVVLFAGFAITVPSHAESAPRRVEVTAKRFSFQPAEVTVKKGETVVLVLKSADVPHGLRFRELNVDVKANRGGTGQVKFTPQQTGTFVGRCSVFCGSGHGVMTLKLHVVD